MSASFLAAYLTSLLRRPIPGPQAGLPLPEEGALLFKSEMDRVMFHGKQEDEGYPQCTGLSNKAMMLLDKRLLLCIYRFLYKCFCSKEKGLKRLCCKSVLAA